MIIAGLSSGGKWHIANDVAHDESVHGYGERQAPPAYLLQTKCGTLGLETVSLTTDMNIVPAEHMCGDCFNGTE